MTTDTKKKILAMDTKAETPYLIEIVNDDLGTFRYVNAKSDVVYEGNTYTAGYFRLDPPDKNESSIGNATLTMSAIDQSWIEKIRSTQKRSTLRFIAVIMYDENGDSVIEPLEDITMTLTSATWDDTTIQWTMIFDETMDIMVPPDIMNSETFPACAT